MKKRPYLVCGALLLAAVAGLLSWSPRLPREPVYDGKPLSYWLSLPRSSDRALSPPYRFLGPYGSTVTAQISGDTNSLPLLIRSLRKGRWFGQTYYRQSLQGLPASIRAHLPPADTTNNIDIRINAASLLGFVGPAAHSAIPALLRTLRADDNQAVRRQAAEALGFVGVGDDRAISALRAAQTGKVLQISFAAELSLSRIKDKAAENAGVQAELAAAGKAGAKAQAEINAVRRLGVDDLAKELRENANSDVRHEAAEALGDLGHGSAVAVAAVTEALEDKGLLVRKAATNALLKIDPEAAASAGVHVPSP